MSVRVVYVLFFVKQKTAYEMRISDWSSDVCSSDLGTSQGSRGDLRERKRMHTVDTRATPGPVAEWPRKTREMHSHHFDSTVWNDFRFRPDDVVIASYVKSGTTWTQQIVGQLIFGGEPGVDVASISPWVDLRVPPREVKLPRSEEHTSEL